MSTAVAERLVARARSRRESSQAQPGADVVQLTSIPMLWRTAPCRSHVYSRIRKDQQRNSVPRHSVSEHPGMTTPVLPVSDVANLCPMPKPSFTQIDRDLAGPRSPD